MDGAFQEGPSSLRPVSPPSTPSSTGRAAVGSSENDSLPFVSFLCFQPVVGFVWHGGGAREEEVEQGAVVDVVEPDLKAKNEGESKPGSEGTEAVTPSSTRSSSTPAAGPKRSTNGSCSSWNPAGDSFGRITHFAKRRWRRALHNGRAFPWGATGPRERATMALEVRMRHSDGIQSPY